MELAVYSLLTLAAAPAIVAADGQWATLSEGRTCEAAAKSTGVTYKDRPPARASLSFDAGGPRHGQFSARLSRVPRSGATVMVHIGDQPFLLTARGASAWSKDARQEAAILAAMRGAGGMRLQARDAAGRRMTDRFLLDGAPTAIDAAAAACSRPR